MIQQSLQYITKKVSCVTFIDLDEVSYTKADHVLFAADGGNSGRSGRGCWSFLGRVGNQQTLNLGEPGCFTLANIVHEVLHALAFVHEQSRPDRDDYIKLNMNKIEPGHQENFKARNWTKVEMRQTYYDYSSILHYAFNAFAKIAGDVTIETVHPGDADSLYAGYSPTDPLSPADVVELSLAYSCPVDSVAMVNYVNTNRRVLSNRMARPCCQQDEQLVTAAQEGDLVKVKNLLRYVDPNSPMIVTSGNTNTCKISCTTFPLIEAAERGHNKIVHVLIAAGADLNIQQLDDKGDARQTALHMAVWKTQVSTVRILVSSGASMLTSRGVSKGESISPFWEVCYYLTVNNHTKNLDMFKYMIRSGADTNITCSGAAVREVAEKRGWIIPLGY